MSITSWNAEDRPREKFAALGATALSKAELLAILVGSGSTDLSAVELMRQILTDHHNSIHELERLTVEQLCAYKGIGPAKAVTILAACALACRYASEEIAPRSKMDNAEVISRYFSPLIANLGHEECHVMLLDNSLRLIASRCVSVGGLSSASVDVRKVMKDAVLSDASALVLCHNHPSGSLTPSRSDDDLTRRVREAATAVGLRMLDHIIVSTGGYYSYQENGKL